jgi:hypothetical protein
MTGPPISPLTPQQQIRRDRIESVIGLAAPVLDLVLAVGERISRVVAPADDYIPIRPPSEAVELEPATRSGAREPATRELAD